MSRRRSWFWPWGRTAWSAPEPSTAAEDDELSAAMRVLHQAESGSPAHVPRGAVEYARRLCRLGAEHRQLADELEATAQLHRDSASRAGSRAASVLQAAVPSPDPAPEGAYQPAPDPASEPAPVPHTALVALPDPAPAPPAVPLVAAAEQATVDGRQADVVVSALGPLEVRVGGVAVESWAGQRTRTLFEYLLVHRRPVHREVLMELLWPGHTYASARNNLNVCLYGLRRALAVSRHDARHIVYRDGCYALNRALIWDVDRDRFVKAAEHGRRLAAGSPGEAMVAFRGAVAAYAGPLFEGDPAADWFANERTALHELFLQVLEGLAGLLLDAGDVDEAQHALERLLREDGCRESAHRLLMSCFARRGQRDLVARQFQRCRTRLATELDITPSAETFDLFRELTATG